MPKEDVSDFESWFISAFVDIHIAQDPVLLLGTGIRLIGSHVESRPPTEIVGSLLRGGEIVDIC